jgi:dihydrofolate reductase
VGKLIWQVTMSLDGFIAGPEHAMDWAFDAFKDAGPNRLGEEVMSETGAILGGRGWYDAARAKYDGVDGIYGGRWTGPVFVLTHHPQEAPDDPKATFVSSLEEALATARDAAGAKNVEIFGANVARQCLDAGSIDEVVIHLAPVLLGDGVRLYGTPPAPRIDLERTLLEDSGRVIDLRYGVRRQRGDAERAG